LPFTKKKPECKLCIGISLVIVPLITVVLTSDITLNYSLNQIMESTLKQLYF